MSKHIRMLLILSAVGALALATTAFAKNIVGNNSAQRLTGTEREMT